MHECGLAFIRLRKPFSYYQQKFGTVLYGLNKLYLLMEKQHNRGQDGSGVATVKLDTEPGYPFLHRIRSNVTMKFTSDAEFFNFSFLRILCRCTSTVFNEMFRLVAISFEEDPSLM